jgi:hypothetical protein
VRRNTAKRSKSGLIKDKLRELIAKAESGQAGFIRREKRIKLANESVKLKLM